MRGVKSVDLLAIVDFLYHGEANVFQESLDSFLAIAEELELKGLVGGELNDDQEMQREVQKMQVGVRATSFLKNEENVENYQENMKLSEPSIGNAHGQFVRTVALTSQCSGALQELEEKVNSMIEKISASDVNRRASFRCRVCGKEGPHANNLKNHIAANHVEGFSVPCNTCEKTFRSKNSWAVHNYREHRNS